jgi:uncharacterized protein YfdQ (DUF2303 family)
MEAEAINKIVQLGTTTFFENNVPTHVFNGATVQSLEEFSANRHHPRGAFATDRISAFVQYAKFREGSGTGNVFVDPSDFSAKLFLDGFCVSNSSAQGHCKDTASVKLTPTPEWLALLNCNGKKFTQRDLIDFLIDWHHAIHGAKELIAAFRRVTITAKYTGTNEVQALQATKSSFEQIEAKNNEIPDHITFDVIPYLELPLCTLTIAVQFLPEDSGNGLFALRVRALETHRQQMAEDFANVLALKMNEADLALPTFIGIFKP